MTTSRTFLYESVTSDHNDKALPSWVPDWTELPARTNLGQTRSNSSGWFFTAGSNRHAKGYEPEFRVEGNILFVKGAIVQTFIMVGRDPYPETQDAPNISNLLAVLADMTFMLQENYYHYPTGEHFVQIMATVLEADQPENDGDLISLWEETISRDFLFEPELSQLDKTRHAEVIQFLDDWQGRDLHSFRIFVVRLLADGSA